MITLRKISDTFFSEKLGYRKENIHIITEIYSEPVCKKCDKFRVDDALCAQKSYWFFPEQRPQCMLVDWGMLFTNAFMTMNNDCSEKKSPIYLFRRAGIQKRK